MEKSKSSITFSVLWSNSCSSILGLCFPNAATSSLGMVRGMNLPALALTCSFDWLILSPSLLAPLDEESIWNVGQQSNKLIVNVNRCIYYIEIEVTNRLTSSCFPTSVNGPISSVLLAAAFVTKCWQQSVFFFVDRFVLKFNCVQVN